VYRNNKAMNFHLSEEKYNKIDKEGMNLLSQMLEVDNEERLNSDEILYHEFFDDISEEHKR
jgi:serine/threonine protein kinase